MITDKKDIIIDFNNLFKLIRNFLPSFFLFTSIYSSSLYATTSSTPLKIVSQDSYHILLNGEFTRANSQSKTVMIIVPFSGFPDIDGNVAPIIQSSIFRKLAKSFAAKGVSVMRYTKRREEQFRSADMPSYTQQMVVDLESWIEKTKALTGVNCVWLFGHSEGALISLIAAKERTDICGLVLAAGPARPLIEVLQSQFDRIPIDPNIKTDAKMLLDRIKSGQDVSLKDIKFPLNIIFGEHYLRLISEMASLDPLQYIEEAKYPIVYVRGSNDVQITEEDEKKVRLVKKKICIISYIGLNHYFLETKEASFAETSRKNFDRNAFISDKITDNISEFLKSRLCAS